MRKPVNVMTDIYDDSGTVVNENLPDASDIDRPRV